STYESPFTFILEPLFALREYLFAGCERLSAGCGFLFALREQRFIHDVNKFTVCHKRFYSMNT
ncbi:hypothetical protein, partial [Bacteroides heparinolyticus]|uniref:hypothetical protein n=1 Tax=Prevotella heparinolytica TaxID=28113 RepID=UPI0035A17177